MKKDNNMTFEIGDLVVMNDIALEFLSKKIDVRKKEIKNQIIEITKLSDVNSNFVGKNRDGYERDISELHYRLATPKEIEKDNLKNIFTKNK